MILAQVQVVLLHRYRAAHIAPSEEE